ncbi:MAG: lamin tail domain-containing protein [Candidatus Thorarchaeota archaeon]
MNKKRVGLLLILSFLMVSVVFTSAADACGYRWRWRRDRSPPIVTITSPEAGETVSGLVTVTFTAVDNSRYLWYWIIIDGVVRSRTTSYDWNTTTESYGEHTITCIAVDRSLNWGKETIHVTVDNREFAFKVMSYNIEASGTNADWKQVVKEENPDILVLVETGTWDDNGNYTLNQVVNEFNTYFLDEIPYVGYCAQDVTYSTSGAAILSRLPVAAFNQIPLVPLDDTTDYDVTHDFVEAVVTIDGVDVHIFGSHLKAMSGATNEYRRERETEGIINYMDNLGDVPIMYMGDLNTFSPDDTGDLAPLGDLGYGPMTMKLYPDDPIYGQYSSTVHNFTDVFRTLNPTDPGYSYGHQDPVYLSRIDYIVVNDFFVDSMINSTCGDTATADTGSDHYSVDVFIKLESTTEPDAIPPAQVAGLGATTISMSQIDLSWDANAEPDISHYRVYRDTVLVAQIIGTAYSDVGLDPLTSYTYEVAAVDTSINEGLKSDSVTAMTEEGGDADLVLINEFLPDPYVLYSEEWVEFYNPQALDADLSGYILDDITTGGTNPYSIPAGTVIPGYGYLVLYQGATGVGLNNAGDTVNLLKPDGVTVIDSYSYPSSVNDISYGRESDGSPTWITFNVPTPGEENIVILANGDPVLINEFLPDPYVLYGEEWIELYNPLDETVDISGYVLDDLIAGGTGPYIIPDDTTIPAYGFIVFYQSVTGIGLNNAGDTVNYLMPDGVTVLDSYVYSSSSNDISYGRETDGSSIWMTFDVPTPSAPNVVESNDGDFILINEFLPDPYVLYGEEWIELYNPLDVDVDISGYVLDDLIAGGTGPYTIPAGTTIPAYGFIVFYSSVTGIGLNNAGDTVNYIMPDGVTVLDSFVYTSSADDISYGREIDGGPTWITFDAPTPGESNAGVLTNGDAVLINEFLADPYVLYGEEWIELYNPLDETVDISGYVLDDLIAGGTVPYTIPSGTTIPAHGFIVFYQSTTNLALNNAGDTVNYIMPDGVTVLDSFVYTSSTNDISYGRETDGASTWITFDVPTPGESNTVALPNGDEVLINEFLADPNTLYSKEWIELYNPMDVEVDISEYVLDDITAGGTVAYTIPSGTTIPAHGFILFNQSVTGIGLNNAGDTVNYIMPDGITVLDSFVYTSSADDISYGRAIDGGPTWITFDVPTPGESNVVTTASGDSILINEFLPDPNTLYLEEWIELYNPLDVDIDISGYIIDDITTGGTAAYTLPAGTIIPAHGYVVLYQGVTNIALNNAGDTVNYINPDGVTVLDSYTYGSSTDDVSYGREIDGSPTWTTFTLPTPGLPNDGTTPSVVVELLAVLARRN